MDISEAMAIDAVVAVIVLDAVAAIDEFTAVAIYFVVYFCCSLNLLLLLL